MKKSNIMNKAAWTKSTSKEEIFNQLSQVTRNVNEKVDKLTNITQNLENKLNGIQKDG